MTDMITHCEAYRAARTLFDYCNGRRCRICIFAERVRQFPEKYECKFRYIINHSMGEDEYTYALLMAKENIDVLRSKGKGE